MRTVSMTKKVQKTNIITAAEPANAATTATKTRGAKAAKKSTKTAKAKSASVPAKAGAAAMRHSDIEVKGARVNNLKNVDVVLRATN